MPKQAPPRIAARKLTARQRRFVEEYLIDLNATQAAVRSGYSARTANEQGARLLAHVSVAEAISGAKAERSARTKITADAVLERLWDIANADPNELIQFRRSCCRCCYGKNFEYQSTKGELARNRKLWEKGQTKASKEVFDEQGGDGFDSKKPPNPSCPECHGEGYGETFVADSRNLSPAARLLYAGVKQTKDGIEIKMRDQDAALVNVGKHLGLFNEQPPPPEDADQQVARIKAALSQMDGTIGQIAEKAA